jgi:hypothetical protein
MEKDSSFGFDLCCSLPDFVRNQYCLKSISTSTFKRPFHTAFAMVVITGITNAAGIPSIFHWIKKKRYFEAFIGILTLL